MMALAITGLDSGSCPKPGPNPGGPNPPSPPPPKRPPPRLPPSAPRPCPPGPKPCPPGPRAPKPCPPGPPGPKPCPPGAPGPGQSGRLGFLALEGNSFQDLVRRPAVLLFGTLGPVESLGLPESPAR